METGMDLKNGTESLQAEIRKIVVFWNDKGLS